MPTTLEILAGLATIANDAYVVAILWHVAIVAALIALARGWRPRRGHAAMLLAAPLASVAVLAFVYGNPFNGAVFGAAVVVLVGLGLRAVDERVTPGARWATALAGVMLGYAWVYPHFLATDGWLPYLYAAPVGLIPCPSLSLAIGLALLGGGVERRVAAVLAVLGVFYGLIGVGRLGVTLDVGLLAGAVGLAVLAFRPTRRTTRTFGFARFVL